MFYVILKLFLLFIKKSILVLLKIITQIKLQENNLFQIIKIKQIK